MSYIFIPPTSPPPVKLHYWAPDINDYPNEDTHDVETYYKKEIRSHSKKIFMLKIWCLADPRIPKAITTTQLVQFFFAANLKLMEAFELLLKHFALINSLPEIFSDRTPNNKYLTKIWDTTKIASFPALTPRGTRIIYTSLYPIKDEEYNMILHVKLFVMALEASILLEGIPKGGYSIIIDTREFPVVILFTEYKSYLVKYMDYFQQGSQFIINDVHVLCYLGYNDRFKWIRSYLSKEMNDKLYFHVYGTSEMWKFYEFIPRNCLPKELNGLLNDEISVLTKKMRIMIESLKLYFRTEEAQRKTVPELDIDKMKKDGEDAYKNAPMRIKLRNDYMEQLRVNREKQMKEYKSVVYRPHEANSIKVKQTRKTHYFVDFDPYEVLFEQNLYLPIVNTILETKTKRTGHR